jgi:hypothetical protein
VLVWVVRVGLDRGLDGLGCFGLCALIWVNEGWFGFRLGGFGFVRVLIFCRAQTETALQNVWLNSSCHIVFIFRISPLDLIRKYSHFLLVVKGK